VVVFIPPANPRIPKIFVTAEDLMMTIKRKALCVSYALIAVLAFVGTWGHNVKYLHLGFWGSQGAIWKASLANPAARANTVDLACFGLAVFIWMLLEAQRLRLKGIWIYALFFMIAGISVSVPVFLIHRERALAALDGSPDAGELTKPNFAGLIVGSIVVVVYTAVLLYLTWK